MSNIFANKKGVKGQNVEEDFLGGGGVLETDIYPAKIKYAYIGKAQNSNARNITISVMIGKHEHRETIWITNRDGDVTYKDRKTGEERNLPGYNQVQSLAMLVAGKDLGDLDVEEKVLNLYDFEAKKEVPQSVQCFTELHDENLHIALQKQIIDKTEKDENSGDYVPTGETREVNVIIKFFPAAGLVTISEVAQFVKSLGGDFDEVVRDGELFEAIKRMEDDGDYATKWLEKNRGETYDKSKGKSEGKAFKGGKSSSGDDSKKKKSSLFDD